MRQTMLITHNRNKNKIKKPYYGPADGKSRPRKHRKTLKAISNALLSTGYKIETQGQENLPQDGAHVYTFNHPTVIDPALAEAVRDIRLPVFVDKLPVLLARIHLEHGAMVSPPAFATEASQPAKDGDRRVRPSAARDKSRASRPPLPLERSRCYACFRLPLPVPSVPSVACR